MAIEHFDEGVYASNFWFGAEEGYEYPARHLYAPPLLPLAIEWTMIIVSLCGFRPTGFVPMIPCLVAGLATIPSLWWVGRRWFGPTAGIVSAWMVAASDFHSSYSRAALTDVPVGLFILWGVYFIWQALQSGTRRDILLGGLFTGLAWWTKYNGWLPLAIGLAGGTAWQLALPRSERRIKEFGARWLMIAVTACVIWSPVLWGLQKHGGYAAVAANHRQYVVGFAGWPSGAWRQIHHVGLYDNWLGTFHEAFGELERRGVLRPDHDGAGGGAMGRMGGGGGGFFVLPRGPQLWFRFDWVNRGMASQFGGGSGGPPGVPTAPSLRGRLSSIWIWLAKHCRRWAPPLTTLSLIGVVLVGGIYGLRAHGRSSIGLPYWLLAAWLAGLTLMTPTYYPYPRLMLPWLLAIFLGMGLAFQSWGDWRKGRSDRSLAEVIRWKPTWAVKIVLLSLLACSSVRSIVGTAHAWKDRAGTQSAVQMFSEQVREITRKAGYSSDEAIVYVCGEPAVVFHLRANGLPLVSPVPNLGFLGQPQPRPTFVVMTSRAAQSEQNKFAWFEHGSAADLLKLPKVFESDLVQLDEAVNFDDLDNLADEPTEFWWWHVRS